jgi:hypothetical protein
LMRRESKRFASRPLHKGLCLGARGESRISTTRSLLLRQQVGQGRAETQHARPAVIVTPGGDDLTLSELLLSAPGLVQVGRQAGLAKRDPVVRAIGSAISHTAAVRHRPESLDWSRPPSVIARAARHNGCVDGRWTEVATGYRLKGGKRKETSGRALSCQGAIAEEPVRLE